MAGTARDREGRLGVAEGLPLLGRDAEWTRLREAIEHVGAGGFRCVFIEGEAGIGKTRLVEEVARTSTAAGFALFSGRAEDLDRLRPFGALVDAVGRLARADGSEMSRLETILRDPSRSAAPLDVIDAFTEFVEERALAGTTCVILEDLHWADPDTLSAVRTLTRRLTYLPILLVGTYRPHPQLPELSRLLDVSVTEGAIAVGLNALDDAAMMALAGELVGTPIGSRLASMLDACSGNPLYAAELVHALEEQGSLTFTDGTTDASAAALPPSLRLTILRRLSQFSTDVVDTLKNAAVLGSSFQLHELAAFCGNPVTEIIGTLQGPISARIVQERDGKLVFRHDLIHEAIYEDMPTPIRASMHVDASRILRDMGVPSVRIAEHMTRGLDLGDPALLDEVVTLMNELRTPAPLVALALAEKALSIASASEQRRDEIRRYMIWPLALTGRRDDARRLGKEVLKRPQDLYTEGIVRLQLAMALAEDGRARDAIAEMEPLVPAVASVPYVSRIVRISMAAARLRAGIFDQVPLVESWVREAREANDTFTETLATGTFAAGLLSQGRIMEAIQEAERYVEMEASYRSVVPTPYLVPALAYMQADRFDDALLISEQGRRRASEVGEVTALAVHSALECLISFLSGAWDESVGAADLTFELIDHSNGSPVGLLMVRASMAQIMLRRGNLDEARLHIREGERTIAERGPQWGTDLLAWTKALSIEAAGGTAPALDAFVEGWDAAAGGHHLLARAAFADFVRLAVAADDRERATQVTEEAEDGRAKAEGIPSVVGTALRCRGLLEDDPDLLVEAVVAFRASPRVLDRAMACEEAAQALLRRGQTSDARSLYDEALSAFDELGAAHDSARVLAAMRAAGIRKGSRAPRRRPTIGWDALTPSELQVAKLTVDGRTNPQIAEQLFISKYTVQTHLSHVFAKLGISSRVALAGIAGERFRPGVGR